MSNFNDYYNDHILVGLVSEINGLVTIKNSKDILVIDLNISRSTIIKFITCVITLMPH